MQAARTRAQIQRGQRGAFVDVDGCIIQPAQRVRQPFNVNSLAQAAALAALGDKNFVKQSRALINREKKFLCDAFLKSGIWFKESATNFIFVRFDRDARVVFKELLKKGIIIREMSFYGLNNYARITIGTRAENNRLIKALKNILNKN